MIPLYNSEPWIAETLRSVLAQEDSGWSYEIIIVDDESTDNGRAMSEGVLRDAAVPWRVIQTKNGGPSKARNLGWRAASGEWIQFLDADDLLHPQKFRRQAPHLIAADSQVAVVYSPWRRFQAGKHDVIRDCDTVIPEIKGNPVIELLRSDNFLAVGSYIIKRHWLSEVGGWDESCWVIEDVHLLLRVAASGGSFQYAHSDEPLLLYRQSGEQSLSKRKSEFIDGIVRNTALAERILKHRGELGALEATILAGCYAQAVSYHMGISDVRAVTLSERVTRLVPEFVPDGPPRFRAIARLVGYRRAIQIGSMYRWLLALMVSARRRLVA